MPLIDQPFCDSEDKPVKLLHHPEDSIMSPNIKVVEATQCEESSSSVYTIFLQHPNVDQSNYVNWSAFTMMSWSGFLGSFLLLCLLLIPESASFQPRESRSCPPHQTEALLQFRDSLTIIQDVSSSCSRSQPKTASWKDTTPCCSWDGIMCDDSTGDVVGLDLSCSWLQGTINSNSSLFALRHLQSLNLAGNDFFGSSVLPNISVFAGMTHLNLSSSSFSGVLTDKISHLSKLVSLDLSNNLLELQNPAMIRLARNLTDLQELVLDSVNMSTVLPISLENISPSLIRLRASNCGLLGKFPSNMFRLPNIRVLDISANFEMRGSFPKSNWSSHLIYLSVTGTNFSGELPHSIGDQKSLEHLDLGNSGFEGPIPASIVNLRELTLLDLSWNNFTGPVDLKKFLALQNLQVMILSGLSISSDLAGSTHDLLVKLEVLMLESCGLTNFPCCFSDMPEMRELNLVNNTIREVPGQCDGRNITFPQLETLSFSSCKLTRFPSFLSQSEGLRDLDLSDNMIEEGIPGWFWGIGINTLEQLDLHNNLIRGGMRTPWKKLNVLSLQNNSFQGPLPIPPRSTTSFTVSQNRFNGSISPLVCQLTSLTTLELAENNLTGTIPECLGNLTSLIGLDLRNNSLTGSLPRSLANCTSLQTLDLSYNKINDTSPQWILGLPLYTLYIQSNNIRGRWPKDFAIRPSFTYIDLSRNNFEGPPPIPPNAAAFYSISGNKFSGEISPLMCGAVNLNFLDLSNNNLTGNLPRCLENITAFLTCFSVRLNKLSGTIPAGMFTQGNHLRTVDLSQNQFEGPLPRSLANCKSLEVLDVGGNKITDSFPYWLEDLPKLQVFSIRSNEFYGQVNDSEKARAFVKLRILDLSSNNFRGHFPDNLITKLVAMMQVDNDKERRWLRYMGDHSGLYSVLITMKGVQMELVKIHIEFTTLDLSNNHFYGEIPTNIGALISLKGLNFSHNRLTGMIPPIIRNLTVLEWLDLSSNELVGEIPKELADLTSLAVLNLSYNKLTGRIPTGRQFNTFVAGLFEGNPGLCGFPLATVCGGGEKRPQPPPSSKHEVDEDWKRVWWLKWNATAAIGYGCGTAVGIYLGYVVLEQARPLWLAATVDLLVARLGRIMNRRRRSHG